MAGSELAGIVDILPPAAPPATPAGDLAWLLLLPPVLWLLWRYWSHSGRWQWRLWWLRRRLRSQQVDARRAAELLWQAYRQRCTGSVPAAPLKAAFDAARFAPHPATTEQLLRLLQQVRDVC